MRFTKQQVTETNEKARERGYLEGKKRARRRGYLGFVFGLVLGSVGTFSYVLHADEVNDFVVTQFHRCYKATFPQFHRCFTLI
jgi:hypothetical protein